MAKALLGFVGGPDPRLVDEVRRLTRRVNDLEAELLRVRAENDGLQAALVRSEMMLLDAADAAPAVALR